VSLSALFALHGTLVFICAHVAWLKESDKDAEFAANFMTGAAFVLWAVALVLLFPGLR
jgi:FtsH-binding integral membrane protein